MQVVALGVGTNEADLGLGDASGCSGGFQPDELIRWPGEHGSTQRPRKLTWAVHVAVHKTAHPPFFPWQGDSAAQREQWERPLK